MERPVKEHVLKTALVNVAIVLVAPVVMDVPVATVLAEVQLVWGVVPVVLDVMDALAIAKDVKEHVHLIAPVRVTPTVLVPPIQEKITLELHPE